MQTQFIYSDSLAINECDSMLKVIDIAQTKVVSVSPTIPVIEVAYRMKVSGATLVPVLSKGKFQGVITTEDIVKHLVANAIDPVVVSARSIMNSNYPLISPDANISKAIRIMLDDNIQILPVVQSSKFLGLVNLNDVILKGFI